MNQAINMRRVMRGSIRLYFAPLVGAFKGIRAELRRADREIQRMRIVETNVKSDGAHQA